MASRSSGSGSGRRAEAGDSTLRGQADGHGCIMHLCTCIVPSRPRCGLPTSGRDGCNCADSHIEIRSKGSVPYLYVGALDAVVNLTELGTPSEARFVRPARWHRRAGNGRHAACSAAAATFMTDDKPKCPTLHSTEQCPRTEPCPTLPDTHASYCAAACSL